MHSDPSTLADLMHIATGSKRAWSHAWFHLYKIDNGHVLQRYVQEGWKCLKEKLDRIPTDCKSGVSSIEESACKSS